ncbi:MAG: M3 family metallopeptidase [Candidatus Aminicenantia bacterium]
MKVFNLFFGLILLAFFTFSQEGENPFLKEFNTPFGVPPFHQIKEEHFLPAIKAGIELHKREIESIVNNPEEPTFENTIESLEKSGSLLRRVSDVFSVLNGCMTNDNMQKIAKEIAPIMARHRDEIMMNPKLFQRVKVVHEKMNQLNLNPEQKRLVEEYYKDFVRGGANLDEEKKAQLMEINQELSLLSVKFGENVLKEENRFELVIENKEDLEGLPESVIKSAEETAKEKGYEGKWVFTLKKPSLIPFLQYSKKRELREKIFKAYINRGNNNDEFDNKKIISRILELRIERAKLLGYKTHAHFILEDNMAKTPEKVYELLNKIWVPALKVAKKEAKELQEKIYKEGNRFKLQPWDWWYYAEKVRKEKYELDEEMLRPYFQLENCIQGAFYVANKLYGIKFEERNDVPKFHPDVKVFQVKEADGTHIGIFYVDYFPRASKRSGAWMTSFRKQSKLNGKMVNPLIVNVGNFTKPTAEKPALLSIEEVETLFHEFGHALHGLLSNCIYPSLSGTAVPRDFVELPSQIMENWALEPEVLKVYAKHYKTGEPIPQALVEKLMKSKKFNQGFATVEYLAASFLDMYYHTLEDAKGLDPEKFEEKSMEKIGLIPEIVVRYRSTNFQHIFSGGYSAGYYSYIWSEVLDADAFEAFKEKGIFDSQTALSFRKNILEKGGSEDPMILYKRFRGREPRVEPLLKKRGLL